MTIDVTFVVVAGLVLEAVIYWFFFGKKDAIAVAGGKIDVIVDGGYNPANIKINNKKSTVVVFERKDPSSCLEEIIIPDFKIKKFLPLNKKVEIILTPQKAGVYQTHCGMGMFHGKIIVE